MKKQLTTVALSAALLLSAGASQAAPLASMPSVTGSVVVERNGQKLPATPGLQLQANDSIMSLEGGSAVVSFGTCQVELSANTLFTVDSVQNCSAPLQQIGTGLETGSTGASISAGLAPVVAIGTVVVTGVVLANQNDGDGTPE